MRNIKNNFISVVILAVVVGSGLVMSLPTFKQTEKVFAAGTAEGHFHPKGKPPSEHTIAMLKQARAGLPFADKRDFEEQKRGSAGRVSQIPRDRLARAARPCKMAVAAGEALSSAPAVEPVAPRGPARPARSCGETV